MRDDSDTVQLPDQGILFPSIDCADVPRRVRCWLIIPEIGQFGHALRVLRSRRHVVVDPESGSATISASDLLLLLNRRDREIYYVGARYLKDALPERFKNEGLGFLSEGFREACVVPFVERRTALPCSALEFRTGPAAPLARDLGAGPLHSLLRELQRMAELAPLRTSEYLARSPGASHLVTGLLSFEAGAMLLAEAPRLTESELEQAGNFFVGAERHLAAAGHGSALRASLAGKDRVEKLLFDRRQFCFDLALEGSSLRPRETAPGIGYRAHALFALPLSPIPLEQRGESAPADERREILFRTPARKSLLQRLLARSHVDQLAGSVRQVGVGTEKAVTVAPQGAPLRFAALLDTHLHQIAGVTSMRGKDSVLVHAHSASLKIVPEVRCGSIGKAVHFGVIGRQAGEHELRFTFLTKGKVVSRIAKTIRILAE